MFRQWLWLIFFPLYCAGTVLGSPEIKVRLGMQPVGMRIVFDSSLPLKTRVSLDETKRKLRVLPEEGSFRMPLPHPKGLIRRMILEENLPYAIIFEMRLPIVLEKQFHIPAPHKGVPHRFVVDFKADPHQKMVQLRTSAAVLSLPQRPVHVKKTVLNPAVLPKKRRVIVVDAGHGGSDPGAIGVNGMQEKQVTLMCAHMLTELLMKTQKYDVVLTRQNDEFLALHERVNHGRKKRGDLFVSLHADSSPKSLTRGLSIYTLSKVASDKEAARLAAKENKADLLGGIPLAGASPEVASILIDLTKRETQTLSKKFAGVLSKSLIKNINLLESPLRSANFAVLRTPDIPAVLIELGYLSNKHDVKLLTSPGYLKTVCGGIVEAINAFYAQEEKVQLTA